MFFGFSGALVSQDYPADYYEINSYISSDTGDFNTLALPWHMYMDYSWNKNQDKRLANVAPTFFTKPVISGDNMEVGGIYSNLQQLEIKIHRRDIGGEYYYYGSKTLQDKRQIHPPEQGSRLQKIQFP